MDIKYLDDRSISDVVQRFKSHMNDESTALGEKGKRAFFEEAVKKIKILPESIQILIDQNRGNLSKRDYLFLHDEFNKEFSKYA